MKKQTYTSLLLILNIITLVLAITLLIVNLLG